MGHLVNPLSLRLSVNSFWNSNWVIINNYNYINVFKKDYQLFTYLTWFFKKSNFEKMNIILSHYKIYRLYKRTYINLYIYNAENQNLKYRSFITILNRFISKITYNKKSYHYRKLYSKKSRFFIINKIYKKIYNYILKFLINLMFWKLMNFINIRFLNFIPSSNVNLFYFNIYSLHVMNISAEAITSHISLRLQKKFSLNWILYPILKDLNNKVKYKNFLGYKLVCSGRFTRKQIATYTWYKNGSLNFNTINNLIRYSEVRVRLKFGLCGIKLWISYGLNNTILQKRRILLITPQYIPYRYKIGFYKGNKFILLFLNNWFFFFIRILFFKNQAFRYYKTFLKTKIKIILLLLLKVYKKKIFKSKNNKSITNKKYPIFRKLTSYKTYINKKLVVYRKLKKISSFSYKILLLKYNKIMIVKSNNINYFKNIYKKIKQKYE